ncbi:hypothetical protein DUI87_17182 [Hirundo rustica rustica]|uniref:Uncharacterized protein n=1 Tax=Hirundo rustica rustica TaxID=333673 RepID=A0A3M0K370_HIRRU|nr:hypothetical protein DUI87_17182 [Hirundo rustica rustica]
MLRSAPTFPVLKPVLSIVVGLSVPGALWCSSDKLQWNPTQKTLIRWLPPVVCDCVDSVIACVPAQAASCKETLLGKVAAFTIHAHSLQRYRPYGKAQLLWTLSLWKRKQIHSLQLKEWPEQAEYLGDNGKIEGKERILVVEKRREVDAKYFSRTDGCLEEIAKLG